MKTRQIINQILAEETNLIPYIRRRFFIESNELISQFKKEEMGEGELTEKCWAGYTQKGMKTMFGKRYPNCVKKTKK